MRSLSMLFLALALLAGTSLSAAAQTADLTGRWEITTTYNGGAYVSGLNLLPAAGGGYTGRSGYLVPDGTFPYHYSGELRPDGLHLKVLTPRSATVIGQLVLKPAAGGLAGTGVLHGLPITLQARRPLPRPATPRSLQYVPTVYYRSFSGANPPALHIFPGDTVTTTTLDANGRGRDGPASMPGNPQTGPFYIEGAMPGDTIAVHFNKIHPNRKTAFQNRDTLNSAVLPPGYPLTPVEGWSDIWDLDVANGTGRPEKPSEKLKNLKVKLIPMLGCVGVAPFWNQALDTSDLGRFGGNLDYNQIRQGTTLYLPVYQAGAILTMGDGHALQEDGEITGQGFETSMDVEFTVELIQDQLLDQPWIENADFIMVSGVGGSLESALQMATAGLTNWLKAYYRLNDSEVATVLGVAMQYDIAEVVDPEVHIVAKIRKEVLAQLPKPADAPKVFCQASWGCLLD